MVIFLLLLLSYNKGLRLKKKLRDVVYRKL
jgi:hypothetical protein